MARQTVDMEWSVGISLGVWHLPDDPGRRLLSI
jgi:hypothetical protein